MSVPGGLLVRMRVRLRFARGYTPAHSGVTSACCADSGLCSLRGVLPLYEGVCDWRAAACQLAVALHKTLQWGSQVDSCHMYLLQAAIGWLLAISGAPLIVS